MPAVVSLVTSRRFDGGGELLRASFRRQSDGALLCEGIPVREGVLIYRTASGGERRELVTREAVLDTARTVARAALTLEHPAEGFIHADSYAKLGVGDVDGEALVEEDAQGSFARVKMAVRRRDALDAIDGGLDELSPGYAVTLDETPGEHPVFGRYDARQVARDCNHLALVPKGRGTDVVLRADSTDAVQIGVAPRIAPPAGSARTPSREDSIMKTGLIALLTALGVSRLDNEDAALTEALQIARGRNDAASARAVRLDAAAKKLAGAVAAMKAASAKRADAADYTAAKAAADAVMKAADEFVAACEGMGEDAAPMRDAAMAARDSAAAVSSAIDAAMTATGEATAAQAEVTTMKADAQKKADAAELARLQGVAGKVGVKHDGLDLPALRVAIAKTRVDSVDATTPAPFLDGILATIERVDAGGKDARWDFAGKREDGADPKGEPKDPRADSHYNPFLAAADKARVDASTSTTGVSR